MTEVPRCDVDFFELSSGLEHVYTKRIALRPAALSDAWPLYEATRNPSFNRYLLWPQPDSPDELLQRLDLLVGSNRGGRHCTVAANVRANGEFIGLFKFIPSTLGSDCVEMGIWMHDKFWHGRYGLELGRLCVSAAFSVCATIGTLVGATYLDNRGSKALMAAVGMTPGRLVMRDTEKGPPVVLQEYVITRDAWQAKHRTEFGEYRPPLPKIARPVHVSETPQDFSIVAHSADPVRQAV